MYEYQAGQSRSMAPRTPFQGEQKAWRLVSELRVQPEYRYNNGNHVRDGLMPLGKVAREPSHSSADPNFSCRAW